MELKKTKLAKIGGLWRIKNGLSGYLDFGMLGQKRVVILRNTKKAIGSKQADYYLYYDTGEEIEKKQKQEKQETNEL
ncbi:MAG: hypothetical protein QW051_00245 [Candidatus Aenigmatarchaeota archaeon]